ncbi:MAG: hypothetical protein BZY88_03620 [SAR202 cluster bacterium Io17-Chloro-G9]|nr:MAG: hypothetical protein BZY88_03620 [SAR202 cluster bacterium Io17-Chloro-G9]
MSSALVSIALALVLGWWTARLARNKGRRGSWIWGAAAFILTLPSEPWRLLGMAPLFVLLFLRKPQAQVDAPPKELNCPRCKTDHPASQRYCVSCGWELARSYPETPATELTEETAQPTTEQPAVSASDTGSSQEAPVTAAEANAETGAKPVSEPAPAMEPVLASQEVSPEVQSEVQVSQAPVDTEQPPQPETAPETLVFRGLPTAANMTERGIWLFNQGRIQESIDQFTKAIALDSNFKEAWEHRAEAYSRLGRGEQAAEDRRRLQAINAGSSSS